MRTIESLLSGAGAGAGTASASAQHLIDGRKGALGTSRIQFVISNDFYLLPLAKG